MKSRITCKKHETGRGFNFDAMRQIAASKAKDEFQSQFILNYIKVEKDRVAASDGHMLTVAEIPADAYHPGYYIVVKNTAGRIDFIKDYDVVGEFPDIDKLMSLDVGETKEISLLWSDRGDSTHNLTQNWTNIIRALPDNATIDFRLFARVKNAESIILPLKGKNIMQMVGLGFKTFIMPMRT